VLSEKRTTLETTVQLTDPSASHRHRCGNKGLWLFQTLPIQIQTTQKVAALPLLLGFENLGEVETPRA